MPLRSPPRTAAQAAARVAQPGIIDPYTADSVVSGFHGGAQPPGVRIPVRRVALRDLLRRLLQELQEPQGAGLPRPPCVA
jgi:hypothetical protein